MMKNKKILALAAACTAFSMPFLCGLKAYLLALS
jgi:hypothetical protein